MLETEIGATGEVTVEGHMIGRLDGFVFVPDAADAGSEAKALQATALKALAGEIDARAERLAAAPETQFVLGSDGTLRWIGAPVAKLIASEDTLRPRLRLVADDRLTGAPRDNVQARLDLWLKTHVEKLLAPLFALSSAEDVTGMARGIAFQLVEALGVLERAKAANDLKALDQPARAMLRKYGVRFGAYHVYLPALLKPAPRTLASLLWAVRQDGLDPASLTGAQQLASSGRTSFPIDKDLSRDLYRTLGYRVAGERAVRVDILERLADLIRPALSWRPASPGVKPQGAFDGSSFTVTQAMMSLTGSAGEDFASILRALGYRMERRPKPAEIEKPPEPVVSQVVPEAQAEAEAAVEQAVDAAAVHEAADDAVEIDATPADDTPAADDAVVVVEAAIDAAAVVATEPAPASVDVSAPQGETAAAPAEPELVEVWRAGRPPGERHNRRPPRRQDAKPQGQAQAEGTETPAGEGEQRRHRRRRHGNRPNQPPPAAAAPADGSAPAEAAPPQGDQRPRHERFPRRDGKRFEGKRDNGQRDGHREGGKRFEGRDNRNKRPDNNREFPPRREQRDRPIDPNSPFAKLAALKEQLEGKK